MICVQYYELQHTGVTSDKGGSMLFYGVPEMLCFILEFEALYAMHIFNTCENLLRENLPSEHMRSSFLLPWVECLQMMADQASLIFSLFLLSKGLGFIPRETGFVCLLLLFVTKPCRDLKVIYLKSTTCQGKLFGGFAVFVICILPLYLQ